MDEGGHKNSCGDNGEPPLKCMCYNGDAGSIMDENKAASKLVDISLLFKYTRLKDTCSLLHMELNVPVCCGGGLSEEQSQQHIVNNEMKYGNGILTDDVLKSTHVNMLLQPINERDSMLLTVTNSAVLAASELEKYKFPIISGSSGAGKSSFITLYAHHVLLNKRYKQAFLLEHKTARRNELRSKMTQCLSAKFIIPRSEPTLFVVDQVNLASSIVRSDIHAATTLIKNSFDNATLIIVGSGHFMPSRQIVTLHGCSLLAVKFLLTQAEFRTVCKRAYGSRYEEDKMKEAYEECIKNKDTLYEMFYPCRETKKSLESTFCGLLKQGQAGWKTEANMLFQDIIEKVLPIPEGGMNIKSVIESAKEVLADRSDRCLLSLLVTLANAQPVLGELRNVGNHDCFYYHECTDNNGLDYILHPLDGKFISDLLLRQPSCLAERIRIVHANFENQCTTPLSKGLLYKQLVFLDLLQESVKHGVNVGMQIEEGPALDYPKTICHFVNKHICTDIQDKRLVE